jgi:predicted PurR-regulated permease PerM
MLTLINILIIFFIVLIITQIFLAFFNNNIIEGLTNNEDYQPYDTNNPNNALILAQQNAGNIQVLRSQLDNLISLKKEVEDISGNVVSLQTQVNGMIGAQQQYAQQMTPSTPPAISGAVDSSSASSSSDSTTTAT